MQSPGSVTLIGSGETSSIGGQVFEELARGYTQPFKICVLETPAGFETNAQRVASRVADFMRLRLQNYQTEVVLVAARKKQTAFSPDSDQVVAPLLDSQMVFFGPGSPTYTVRQLEDSLAWHIIQARHRLGTSLVLASAATIAIGAQALPVYEIFKVGEDPHWKNGLDLFHAFNLRLVIIPHWNNREGGDDVDTSRCFIGQARFDTLRGMLPDDVTVLGIDEHTAITIDFEARACHVRGVGEIHLIRGSSQQDCAAGCSFPIEDLGSYRPLDIPSQGIPLPVWDEVLAAHESAGKPVPATGSPDMAAPQEVQELVDARQKARAAKDWRLADTLRGQINDLGWTVKDTPGGPIVTRNP